MRLYIFKHRGFWWACIITPGGGFEPAAPFLSWESAVRIGLQRLEHERKLRERRAGWIRSDRATRVRWQNS